MGQPQYPPDHSVAGQPSPESVALLWPTGLRLGLRSSPMSPIGILQLGALAHTVIPVLVRWRQEDFKFEPIWGNLASW